MPANFISATPGPSGPRTESESRVGVWYTTREDVKSALDSKETARNNASVDRAIEGASRAVEGYLHRTFYPQIGTRYVDWPNRSNGSSWRVWLEQNELISASAITSGGVALSPANYLLEPTNDGPPYDRLEINRGTTGSFDSGSTSQRNIAITGTFGYSDTWVTYGATAEALDGTETDVDVNGAASTAVGVGSVIKVDSEVMLVTDRTLLTTGTTLNGSSVAQKNDTTQVLVSGAAVTVGEVITMNSEKMLVVSITSNSVTVIRGWDGSTLATHSNSTVFAPRTLQVQRGALGSTVTTHLTATAVQVWQVPGLLRSLVTAEAVNMLLQESAGYARSSNSGDGGSSQQFGRGLDDLRKQAKAQLGRNARMRTV